MAYGASRLLPSCAKDFKYGYIPDEKAANDKSKRLYLTKSGLVALYNQSRVAEGFDLAKFEQVSVGFYINNPAFVWESDQAKKIFDLHLAQMRKSWPCQISA